MPLTNEQRAELEALGPATVRAKLSQPGAGRGAAVYGFKTGILGGLLTRGDVEDWLTEKHAEEAAQQQAATRAAVGRERFANWLGIVGVIVGIAGVGRRRLAR